MLSIKERIFKIFNSKKENIMWSHILFRIVSFNEKTREYSLQCINTSAVFQVKIMDIIYDESLLYSLHPVQSCYIGLEYANLLKSNSCQPHKLKNKISLREHKCRYGIFELYSINRLGNINFLNVETGERSLMDPRDMALSNDIIQEFDSAHAYYIGLFAGLKMDDLQKSPNSMKSRLSIVK